MTEPLPRRIPGRCDMCWSETRPLKRYSSAAGSVGYVCTDDEACADDWSRMVRGRGGKRLRRHDAAPSSSAAKAPVGSNE